VRIGMLILAVLQIIVSLPIMQWIGQFVENPVIISNFLKEWVYKCVCDVISIILASFLVEERYRH